MSHTDGALLLTRLALHRDRMLIGTSSVLLVALLVGSAAATAALYSDAVASLATLTAGNTAMVALYGPLQGGTPDALAIYKTYLLGGIGLAMLVSAIVRRHTRVEEETDRMELLRSGVVGRFAPTVAALFLSLGVTVVVAVVAAIGLSAVGLGAGGAWAVAAGWCAVGVGSAAITAVAVQVSPSSRVCTALALGVLAGGYLLRAVADTAGGSWEALRWLSPVGWAQQVNPYQGDHVAVLVVAVGAAVALLAGAAAVIAHRDLGTGLVATRPGPPAAATMLRSPSALIWRQDRSLLTGWILGYLGLGLLLGWLTTTVGQLADDDQIRDLLAQFGGGSTFVSDAFLAVEIRFAALGAAALGVAIIVRLAREESAGRVAAVLATPQHRARVLLSYIAAALAGTASVMVALALGIAVTLSGEGGFPAALAHVGPSALSVVPAIWAVVSAAVLIVGTRPEWAGAGWVLLAGCLVVGEFGVLLRVPQVVIAASPFEHGFALPGASPSLLPLLALISVGAALLAAAGGAFRRRDIR